jgi:excisionase family DNA binding protein
MEPLFYSTGQVARQLGTTRAAVRIFCETGVMASETTTGGHLRIPEAEVKRFKRDGVPPIPRPLPAEAAPSAKNGLVHHSDFGAEVSEVTSAADLVAVTRSVLEKRKIEREIEENEDWFRERERQRLAEETIERRRTEAERAEHLRQQWVQQWMQYAMNSVPSAARREVEIEVYTAVDAALFGLLTSQAASITQRVVDAAVHRALRPWTRKQEIERALNSAIDKLPWAVRNSREYVPLKLRASEAAVEAVGRLREEASYQEMETVTVQAVQPVIRAFEHHEGCQRILGRVYLLDATREEQEAAKEAARKALTALPIGASTKELEKAKDAALAPYKAAVCERKEKARLESERQAQRRAAEWKADLQLDHIACYLQQEYDFDGGYVEMRGEAERLRPLIRRVLIDQLIANPNLTFNQIRKSIEEQIDDEV